MSISKNKPINSLPAECYTDDKFLKKEKNQIFLKSWLLIGPEAHIPNPGDCLFQSIVDQPIVCVRQEDNSIKTFFNICRHRAGSFENKKSKNNYLESATKTPVHSDPGGFACNDLIRAANNS